MQKNIHVVVKNDTLWGISKRYGVPYGRLLQLNPERRGRPDHIHAGMEIRISDKADVTDTLRIARMVFDGKQLTVYSRFSDQVLARYPATSGLPPKAKRLAELIKDYGRKDLQIDIDYRQPKYQKVNDAGPIPEGYYGLRLKSNMSYDKSIVLGDPDAWGEGGWILKEGILGRLDDLWGGRSGFFLHHDGYPPGTSGCIGLKNKRDMRRLKSMLIRAYTFGQRTVLIKVRYGDENR